MFEEQYRRDNERLHAPADALEKIKRRAETPMLRRSAWVRYAAAAAALLLVVGGTMGVLLGRGGAGSGAAAPQSAEAKDVTTAESAPMELCAGAGDGAVGELAVATDYGELYERIEGMRGLNEGGKSMSNAADRTSGAAADGAMPVPEEPMAAPVPAAAPAADANDMGGMDEYSGTNVQVPGVDEADIVKTDGEYIYYLANGTLYIVDAAGSDTALLSRTKVSLQKDGDWREPLELYLSGDRLVVLVSAASLTWSGDGGAQEATYALVYDVSDPAAPGSVASLGQSGYYVSSRMVDGMVYVITTQHIWGSILRDEPRTYCPVLYDGEEPSAMAAGDICIRPGGTEPTYTVVSAIDVAAAGTHAAARAVLGGSDTVYMSGEHLLVAATEYRYEEGDIEKDAEGRSVRITRAGSDTSFVLFALDGGQIRQTASATLPGCLLNQFSMDEYDGVFRVVTTVDEWEERLYTDGVDTYEYEDAQYNCLYTLDAQLQVLGSIERIAEGEHVESVRFDGEIGYFVTFRQVDPLFTVDLSDPAHPKILGALKIPGFSEYLHPFGTDRLLGLGYRADEDTGRTEGVKLSMFDTSDKADVKELAACAVNASWTVVGGNHHAILISVEKSIIAFPADTVYLVYSYTDAAGFVKKSSIGLDGNLPGYSTRGLFIGSELYVLCDTGVTVVSLDTYKTLATLDF